MVQEPRVNLNIMSQLQEAGLRIGALHHLGALLAGGDAKRDLEEFAYYVLTQQAPLPQFLLIGMHYLPACVRSAQGDGRVLRDAIIDAIHQHETYGFLARVEMTNELYKPRYWVYGESIQGLVHAAIAAAQHDPPATRRL